MIDGAAADPYDALVRAKETDIRLVMINGIARYGVPDVMQHPRAGERDGARGRASSPALPEQETADPDVAEVSLSTATGSLRDALRDIAKLAKETEKPKPAAREPARPRRAGRARSGRWRSTRSRTAASTCVRDCRSAGRATSPVPSAPRARSPGPRRPSRPS